MAVGSYPRVLEAFLDGRTTAGDFEARFLELFLADGRMHPTSVYRTLNTLCLDADAFCADPALRGSDEQDEERLRASVAAALVELSGQQLNGT